MVERTRTGPLSGLKIIELAGIGPGPFTCMMLADAGAQVLRLERAAAGAVEAGEEFAQSGQGSYWDLLNRSRPSVGVDLKNPDARSSSVAQALVAEADGLIEGFRPGVAERLGVGPEHCFERNKRLVYGRMTGWGQDGPMASMAGHDIDYIAIGGALWSIGRADEPPVPPLNLVGDFGGGGLLLAFGMVCALREAERSGQGQVVDAAMVDGAASLMTMIHAFHQHGLWGDERGANMLDTGAPFYEVYETSDGKWMAVGGIESQFYAELIKRLGLEGDSSFRTRWRDQWPAMKVRFGRGLQVQDPRRVVGHLRGLRRLRRAGVGAMGGAPPPAQRGPLDLRRGRWRRAAGAGASLLAHAVVDLLAALAPRRRDIDLGAGRVGRLLEGRREEAARVGGAQLAASAPSVSLVPTGDGGIFRSFPTGPRGRRSTSYAAVRRALGTSAQARNNPDAAGRECACRHAVSLLPVLEPDVMRFGARRYATTVVHIERVAGRSPAPPTREDDGEVLDASFAVPFLWTAGCAVAD